MNYTYFTLDKNPKQFKKVSIGGYDITLRIEWNTRSECWYVLGYIGNDMVLRNTKVIAGKFYSFDQDSEYDLPYLFTIQPKFKNYNWGTEALLFFVDDMLADTVEGLTQSGDLLTRTIATSSDTHSRKTLRGVDNKYLFDVISKIEDTGIVINCSNAGASFQTIFLPQGRWDFTVNGTRNITANTQELIDLMSSLGVEITDLGNNQFFWTNNSEIDIKIEGLYPYAAGYNFNVDGQSNDSLVVHSRDNNEWVNRFSVCLIPASSLIWTITSSEVSSDYQYVNFTGEKSVFTSTSRLSTTQALVEKYKNGVDPYSATIVSELTGVSDWILDPDNNQIKYIDPATAQPVDPTDPSNQYIYWITYGDSEQRSSIEEICKLAQFRQNSQKPESEYENCVMNGDNIMLASSWSSIGYRVNNPAYDPQAEPDLEEKSILLTTVAQQVISNAANSDAQAQQVIVAAANELIQNTTPADLSDQFEANKQPK